MYYSYPIPSTPQPRLSQILRVKRFFFLTCPCLNGFFFSELFFLFLRFSRQSVCFSLNHSAFISIHSLLGEPFISSRGPLTLVEPRKRFPPPFNLQISGAVVLECEWRLPKTNCLFSQRPRFRGRALASRGGGIPRTCKVPRRLRAVSQVWNVLTCRTNIVNAFVSWRVM